MEHTLIIRPKKGTFLKNYDMIGQMDPFIRVLFDKQKQDTDIANNQGKTPAWKKDLVFKVTPQQYAQADTVILTFEAYDKDPYSEEFIGKFPYKLSQALRHRAGELVKLDILDSKNASVGNIDVEFEFKMAGNPAPVMNQSINQSVSQKMVKHMIGTVAVKPTSGKFDVGVTDHQQLYLVFSHGGDVPVAYQSNVSEGPGRRPIFNDIISFQWYEGEDMFVRCFDNDPDRNELIGEGPIDLNSLAKRGPVHSISVPLTNFNKRMGEIVLEVEFFPDICNNPVKVYPGLRVRRGEYVCKKIKYSNPDKFKKVIRVKSENRDLVLVKTETLTILPHEAGEIKFKIFAPSRLAEDKCRVDIILEDTHVTEESLLFKIKAV